LNPTKRNTLSNAGCVKEVWERVAVNRIQRMARTHLLRKRCLGPPAEYTHPIDRNTL
jgi:hypothetical protein